MEKIAIGIMSGTSLDGIDVVITKIEGFKMDTKLNILAFQTVDYDESLLKRIKKSLSLEESSSKLLCSLNFELGFAYANAVKKVCKDNNIPLDSIDFIASHGQTIFHIGEADSNNLKSSLQLGEGAVIANECRTTVVSNFRVADIAAGGQGAPLVPYADYLLFTNNKRNIVLNNIGGISNITVLKKNGTLDEVVAFDTGVGNMMIDYACKQLFNINFDDKGNIARSGDIINEMLEELLNHEFLKKLPPKSTGREEFGDGYTNNIITKYQKFDKKDIITTLTYFTALSIAFSYKDYIFPFLNIDEIIISGGGSYNDFLIELLKEQFSNIKVLKLEDIGFNSSSKEALAFVILANETLNFNYSNVKNATGANNSVILGQVNYYFENS